MNSTEGAEAVPWGELNAMRAKRPPLPPTSAALAEDEWGQGTGPAVTNPSVPITPDIRTDKPRGNPLADQIHGINSHRQAIPREKP